MLKTCKNSMQCHWIHWIQDILGPKLNLALNGTTHACHDEISWLTFYSNIDKILISKYMMPWENILIFTYM